MHSSRVQPKSAVTSTKTSKLKASNYSNTTVVYNIDTKVVFIVSDTINNSNAVIS